MLRRRWDLYKIGAIGFRNKVKHDTKNSLRKAEFMAAAAERVVDMVWRTCGYYLLNAFIFSEK